MWSYSNFFLILQIQLCILTRFCASGQNSPSPQLDPDWISQGWYCQHPLVPEGLNNGIVDCIKVLPGPALLQDADRLCASLKREQVDVIVPTLLVFNSKEEQDSGQWQQQVKLAAGILNGGSVGFWVGPGTFWNSHLPRATPGFQGPPRPTQGLSGGPAWSRPDCGELKMEVFKQGMSSGTRVYWNPIWCTERSRVICRTRKVRVSYLLELLERQRKEWSNLNLSYQQGQRSYGESQREVARLNARNCVCGNGKSGWFR